jgi:hypothetical protein
VDWNSIRRRRKSSIARMIFGNGLTRTKSLIFLAIPFGQGDRRIARASSSLISVRRYRTRQRRPSATPSVAGICLGAVTRLSRISRGCSIRLSEVGFNTTDTIIAMRALDRDLALWARRKYKKLHHHLRRATHWIARLSRRAPELLAHWQMGCGVAPWWELYESRGSRTVLREPRGAIPRGYSPRDLLPWQGR